MTDVLNKNTIAMLQEVLEDGFAEVVGAFLTDTPQRLQEAKENASNGDLVALERAAHAIKGSSANIGADQVHLQASAVVDGCRSGNLKNPEAAVELLAQAFEAAKPELLALK